MLLFDSSAGVVIVPAVATGSNGGTTGSTGGHNRSKSRAANVLPATGPALPAEDNDEGKPSLIINTGPPITAIVPQTVTFGAATPKPLAFGTHQSLTTLVDVDLTMIMMDQQ